MTVVVGRSSATVKVPSPTGRSTPTVHSGVDWANPPTTTVDVPTIIIWGTQDPSLHRGMARDSHKYCTDGQVELLEDATHWLQHKRSIG